MGFQKLRTGRGSVLTKYESVASRVDFVYEHFCRYGGTLFPQRTQRHNLGGFILPELLKCGATKTN